MSPTFVYMKGRFRWLWPVAVALGLSSLGVAGSGGGPVRFVAPHFHEELQLFGVGDDGRLLPAELGLLAHLMRCRRTGRRHEIAPELAADLVALARRFERPVYILSGYRAVPLHGHRRSYHLRGMAADVYVPGVSPREIRDWAVRRQIRGIGYYPESGFVHLDARPERFWWVDYSSPGRADRLVPDPEGDAPPHPDHG